VIVRLVRAWCVCVCVCVFVCVCTFLSWFGNLFLIVWHVLKRKSSETPPFLFALSAHGLLDGTFRFGKYFVWIANTCPLNPAFRSRVVFAIFLTHSWHPKHNLHVPNRTSSMILSYIFKLRPTNIKHVLGKVFLTRCLLSVFDR